MQVIFILCTVQDDTPSSVGQGTTSSLPFYPKKQCRKSASLLSWVKFIFTPGVSSSCDMVGMCTRISFAVCSPSSPSLFPPRTCSSPPLMPHLIHCPGYHGICSWVFETLDILCFLLRSQRIDFTVETHMLSVWFQTLTVYPNARSPSTGVLIDLDDAIWLT